MFSLTNTIFKMFFLIFHVTVFTMFNRVLLMVLLLNVVLILLGEQANREDMDGDESCMYNHINMKLGWIEVNEVFIQKKPRLSKTSHLTNLETFLRWNTFWNSFHGFIQKVCVSNCRLYPFVRIFHGIVFISSKWKIRFVQEFFSCYWIPPNSMVFNTVENFSIKINTEHWANHHFSFWWNETILWKFQTDGYNLEFDAHTFQLLGWNKNMNMTTS